MIKRVQPLKSEKVLWWVMLVSAAFTLTALFFSIGIMERIRQVSLPEFVSSRYMIAAVAGLIYLSAHFLRALRLWVMLIEDVKKFSDVVRLHFFSSWIVGVLPFKLGEPFRLLQCVRITKSPLSGTAVFVLEKIMDTISVLILTTLGTSFILMKLEVRFLNLFLVFLLFGSVLLWFSSDGLISYLRKIILIQSKSKRGLAALKIINLYENLLQVFKAKISFRFSLLLLMSLTAWILDIVSYMVLGRLFNLSLPEIFQQIIEYIENTIVENPFMLSQLERANLPLMDLSTYISKFTVFIMFAAALLVMMFSLKKILAKIYCSLRIHGEIDGK
ncbi:hypothetical protein [Bdellovibrio sp. HCB209]|uniref:hypothetical protein n=1 Tax=Bdellovibrio sp. HCB209 TaxID=3394354 RepID=UPI0039B53BC2